jgi:hypothetical protein
MNRVGNLGGYGNRRVNCSRAAPARRSQRSAASTSAAPFLKSLVWARAASINSSIASRWMMSDARRESVTELTNIAQEPV